MDIKEKTVEESRFQKLGKCVTTIKISKRSLSNFDDKRFYVYNIKSYPIDENMYLFKRNLLNKIGQQTSFAPNRGTMVNPALIGETGSLINNI